MARLRQRLRHEAMEIRCGECGQMNRIPDERDGRGVWSCGRCTHVLLVEQMAPAPDISSTTSPAAREPVVSRTWDIAGPPPAPPVRSTAAHILASLSTVAVRAATALTDWLRGHRQAGPGQRPIIWNDTPGSEPAAADPLPVLTDPTTGERIAPGAEVYVCGRCEATYLAANWRDLKAREGDACPMCRGRRCVKRGERSAEQGCGKR